MKTDGNGMNALLLVAANDVRKVSEDKKEEKNMSDEEKQKRRKKREDYFKCAKLILGAITDEKKITVLKQTARGLDALMWCCENGNMQGAEFILEQCPDEKTKEEIVTGSSGWGRKSPFHQAIIGGNMDLILTIHGIHKSFGKDTDLIQGTTALQVAFQHGNMQVADWILFDLMTQPKERMEFLNRTISSCKSGRRTEDAAKRMATRILEEDLEDMKEEKDIKLQSDINNIKNVFNFMMKQELSTRLFLAFGSVHSLGI